MTGGAEMGMVLYRSNLLSYMSGFYTILGTSGKYRYHFSQLVILGNVLLRCLGKSAMNMR